MINRTTGEDIDLSEYGEDVGPWGLVFHHRLLSWIDKNGNVNINGEWLKGRLFVYDKKVSAADCLKFAGKLPEHIDAIKYSDPDGKGEYMHFPNFLKNQPHLRQDRENPEYPEYKADNTTGRNKSGEPPESGRNESGKSPVEDQDQDQDQVEVNKTTYPLARARACDLIWGYAFNVYGVYAKHVRAGAKMDAAKSIKKLLSKHKGQETYTPKQLKRAIKNYIYSEEFKDDPQFRIQANNFFGKAARFMDFLESANYHSVTHIHQRDAASTNRAHKAVLERDKREREAAAPPEVAAAKMARLRELTQKLTDNGGDEQA